MRARCSIVLALLVAAPALAQKPGPMPAYSATNLPGIFWLPQVQDRYLPFAVRIQQLFTLQQYAAAESFCTQAVAIVPWDAGAQYNLACAEARLGKIDAAFETLTRAIELGFRDPEHLRRDPDLASLRVDRRFAHILALAMDTTPPEFLKHEVHPLPIEDTAAWVTESNTAWEGRSGTFLTLFIPDTNRVAEIVTGHGEAGDLLRQWFKEGTAAGNLGDLYDNRDGGHSRLPYQNFPQLAHTEYSAEAKAAGVHWGLQSLFFFNAVTFGNSSTAETAGPYWRGQARFAYVDARKMMILYFQYVRSALYLYPEHRDYDPGVDGEGGGYGDVACANSPYLIVSQGSSGSDQPFMDAVACTLAAFRPEVKSFLARTGALMPTVQMIFRQSNRMVRSPEDYLTGKAHPTVFDDASLDLTKMIRLAHEMPSNAVPPVIQLKVEEEDEPVVGRDYFDAAEREKIFDTPCAIARVARSMQYSRRMVVSAKATKDLNGRPLTFTWRVLRGDADRITIKPLNRDGSQVELHVPYHERGPIAPGSPMISSRVDIGAFANNGAYYSAPGFVCFYYLANEKRVYDEQKRIAVCDYADPDYRKRYTDPVLDLPKDWRDEYHYDARGQLTGWTRVRGEEKQEFTADGALVTQKDDTGRAGQARTVVYAAKGHGRDQAPTLEQELGNESLTYQYASAKDRVGRIKSREVLHPDAAPAASTEPETPAPVE